MLLFVIYTGGFCINVLHVQVCKSIYDFLFISPIVCSKLGLDEFKMCVVTGRSLYLISTPTCRICTFNWVSFISFEILIRAFSLSLWPPVWLWYRILVISWPPGADLCRALGLSLPKPMHPGFTVRVFDPMQKCLHDCLAVEDSISEIRGEAGLLTVGSNSNFCEQLYSHWISFSATNL
jgi:hypothetical protein